MKKKKLKLMTFMAIVSLGVIAVLQPGCKKEGPEGPAGKDGSNGVNTSAVSAADQTAYDAADGMIGGRLYDYFVNELKDENASNQVTDATILGSPNKYRCKSCHGWDLMGRRGHLAQQAITASYPEVANNNLYEYAHMHNIREVFDAIKNSGGNYIQYHAPNSSTTATMPDYGTILSDAQIWQLVKFLKKEAMNATDFYDMAIVKPYPQAAVDEGATSFTNIGKNGNVANGVAFITSHCGSCHGTNGTNINIYCKGDYLGNTFRDDPFEVQHKVKFGMPKDYDHLTSSCTGQNNNAMPAISGLKESDIRDVLAAGQDTTAYPSY